MTIHSYVTNYRGRPCGTNKWFFIFFWMRIHIEAFSLGVVMNQEFSDTEKKKIKSMLHFSSNRHLKYHPNMPWHCCFSSHFCINYWRLDLDVQSHQEVVLLKEFKKNVRGFWGILNACHMAFMLNLWKWPLHHSCRNPTKWLCMGSA